jgi:hypothetical protein
MTDRPDTEVVASTKQADDEDSVLGLFVGALAILVVVVLFVPWWVPLVGALALSEGIHRFKRWTRK